MVKVASGQISSHLSHQVNEGLSLSMKPLKIRPSGAIYLPSLVPYSISWSTQKGMSTSNGPGAQLDIALQRVGAWLVKGKGEGGTKIHS